jgi:hypothetical protein
MVSEPVHQPVHHIRAPELSRAPCTIPVHGLFCGFAVNQTRAPQLKWAFRVVHGLFLGAPVHPYRGNPFGARAPLTVPSPIVGG